MHVFLRDANGGAGDNFVYFIQKKQSLFQENHHFPPHRAVHSLFASQ